MLCLCSREEYICNIYLIEKHKLHGCEIEAEVVCGQILFSTVVQNKLQAAMKPVLEQIQREMAAAGCNTNIEQINKKRKDEIGVGEPKEGLWIKRPLLAMENVIHFIS